MNLPLLPVELHDLIICYLAAAADINSINSINRCMFVCKRWYNFLKNLCAEYNNNFPKMTHTGYFIYMLCSDTSDAPIVPPQIQRLKFHNSHEIVLDIAREKAFDRMEIFIKNSLAIDYSPMISYIAAKNRLLIHLMGCVLLYDFSSSEWSMITSYHLHGDFLRANDELCGDVCAIIGFNRPVEDFKAALSAIISMLNN